MPTQKPSSRKPPVPPEDRPVRAMTFAVLYLEGALDEIYARLMVAQGDDFNRLAGTLARASTALFHAHRTLSMLNMGASPLDTALRELGSLDFDED